MGRTRGSLNKKYKKVVKDIKRKRGRPKNKVVEVIEEEVVSIVKTKKFIGFCPSCKALLCKLDLKSKTVFICPHCEKSGRVKALKKTLGSSHKPLTKKEYLENTVNTKHYQMPALNDHEISPDDLKVVE